MFRSHYSRNTSCKAVAAIDNGSSDGSRQRELKTFRKGFFILDTIKNINDPWEEVKMSTLTGIWEKLIPTLMEDFEGFRTSVVKVIADVVK